MNRYSSKKYGLLSNEYNKETLEAFKLAGLDNIDIYSFEDKLILLNRLNAGDTLLLESLKMFNSIDDIFRFINILSTDIRVNLRCLHEGNINFNYDDSIEDLLDYLRLMAKLENKLIELISQYCLVNENDEILKYIKEEMLRTIKNILKYVKFDN